MYKIVLVGRPNVGKSTLFNRLIRSNRAITHDRAGITRDRMEGTVRNKFHRPFMVTDTGGITLDHHANVAEGPAGIRGFEAEILRQTKEAIEESVGICLVVDARDGLTPFDEYLANYLRKINKPLLLVVNKVDGMEKEDVLCADFHVLGFDMVAVSAEHGHQVRYLEELMSDMLPEIPDFDEEEIMEDVLSEKGKFKKNVQADDAIENENYDEDIQLIDFEQVNQEEFFDFNEIDEVDEIDEADEAGEANENLSVSKNKEIELNDSKSEHEAIIAKPEKRKDPLKICLLGRPNAGKSSILNAFLGKERMIVSDVAGTTRDSVDVPIVWQGNTFIFVDTAGVRRRTKISDIVERYSVNSSLKSTTKADVTFLVIDALQGLTAQDKRLIELLDERKTPFLIILNKMDLVPASARKSLLKQFSETLAFCHHIPVMQTSAKSRYGLKLLLPMAEQIKAECFVRVGTGQLNRAMEAVLTKHQPPVVKRVRPKFYYLTQAESAPPTFVFFVNDAERVTLSYLRYIEKSLRRLFCIEHAPMRVHLRSSHTKNKKNVKTKTDKDIKEQNSIQYIDQNAEQKGQAEQLENNQDKNDKNAGKAKANPRKRTTLKAALRNPNSIQSRSLKKTLRKKK